MPERQDLDLIIEKINKKFNEFKETNDAAEEQRSARNGEALAETQEKLDKINADITELRKEQNQLEKIINRPKVKNDIEMTPELELHNRAYEKFIRFGNGETGQAQFTDEEKRALAGTADTDGQFLVPIDFESELIMNAYDMAAVRPLCQVGTTSRDVVQLGALSKPTVAWGKRAIAVTEQTLDAGGMQVRIFNLRALTLISNDTLDDAEADVMGELRDAFEMALAEAEDDAFIAGADADTPPGIMSNSVVLARYKATGVADAIADATHNGMDAVQQLYYGVKATYRRNGTFAMNSTTEALFRALKNGEGDYYWEPSMQAGTPVSLMGRPVVNPEGMADVAANSYPAVFGDFRSGYKIRDRAGMTMTRLIERYAEYDQVGILIKKRTGGQVTLPEAFCPLKVAAS